MIIVSDISRDVLHTIRARFRLALRWNPRRSPAIELDRQGRIYRRFGRTRGSARFMRPSRRDRSMFAGPEDSPRPHPRLRSRRR